MRTEEQKAADEALTAAIERTARAYGILNETEMTQEYVVVMAVQSWNAEEDESNHNYSTLMRDGSNSGARLVGLLEVASFDIKMGRRD